MKYFLKQERKYFNLKLKNYFYIIIFFLIVAFPLYFVYASFSCYITTQATCPGTVLLRMSDSQSAHAELPSQSTAVYDNNVVCCTGITGLGSSCASGNREVFARLSGVTNSHVEKNTENNVNYTENACLSSKAGDIITVGYQDSDCSGYDTTLFSMENTPTNSMVGIPSAYPHKVCATVFSASLSFDISSNSIVFGDLNSGVSGIGSNNIRVSTNASGGFILTYEGPTLTSSSGSNVIHAYGSKESSIPGNEGFGINLKDNSVPDIGAEVVEHSGVCNSPVAEYGTADRYSYVPDETTPVANQSSPADCTYTISYVSNISSVTPAGSYSAPITYIVTGTF